MLPSKTDSNVATPSGDKHPFWLRAAVWFGLLGMLLACLSRDTAIDPDVFHELALIRTALEIGRIPRDDVFACTPTVSPVVHHEWGTGAILYLLTITCHLGATGLVLVKYTLFLFIAIGACLCARLRGATDPVVSGLAPLAIIMAAIGISTVRAQVFTLACLVGLLLLLTAESRGRRWWIPVWLLVYVIWLNLHAGFLAGFGLFGVSLFERFVRETCEKNSLWKAAWHVKHLAGCLLLMVLLIAVNPYGLDYYAYLWRAVLLPRPMIVEWNPLSQVGGWELVCALLFSLAMILYVARQDSRQVLPGMGMVLITALLATRHARHLPIYALVWICCAPAWIEPTKLGQKMDQLWRRWPRWVYVFWLICGVLGVAYAGRNRFWEPRLPTMQSELANVATLYPAGAVDYLAQHGFRGNLLVPYDVGAFVTWKLYPAVRVSTDSRYEVAYPPGQVEKLEAFFRAERGWQKTLNQYEIDAILIPWWSSIGDRLLELQDEGKPNWQKIYQDDAFSIYLRQQLATEFPVVDRTKSQIRGHFP